MINLCSLREWVKYHGMTNLYTKKNEMKKKRRKKKKKEVCYLEDLCPGHEELYEGWCVVDGPVDTG